MLKTIAFMKKIERENYPANSKFLRKVFLRCWGSLVSVLAREGGLWRLYDREYDAISPYLLAAKCQNDLLPIYSANGEQRNHCNMVDVTKSSQHKATQAMHVTHAIVVSIAKT